MTDNFRPVVNATSTSATNDITKPMTDNLKTRIAEAIRKTAIIDGPKIKVPLGNGQYITTDGLGGQKIINIDAISQAVLDIVEPLLPKWGEIKDAPTEYEGIMYFYAEGYKPKSMHFSHKYNTWYFDYSCLPIDDGIPKYTHYYIMPTAPAKE